MDAAAQAAVGAGDDVFAADDFNERDEAVGHQCRVFDEIGGVADNTWNQDLPGGEFHVAPDFEFMFVTDGAGFDQVRWVLRRSLPATANEYYSGLSHLDRKSFVAMSASIGRFFKIPVTIKSRTAKLKDLTPGSDLNPPSDFELSSKTFTPTAGDQVDDFSCGHNGSGVVWDIDVKSSVHLLIRVIRGRVFYHRDLVAKLSGITNSGLHTRVCYEPHDYELMDAVFL